ncbi:hypothetical protein MCOR25_004561 [Pyricularia grisea]|uniref:Uncharacterized protein n=1 Tax=Pyricularia grisea TaxID=148305 RepID=A0A6P8B3P9_PYRGI|nr:hypothetical protein PgNI_05678 [Pyricularia grisea]KAI6368818.1 hypothetical protein MCOR25_004561 [Pyricularia grisea]TLD09971.1 hypothetical protein PgNI_05678 [Pyricularia grisea]
MSSSNSTVETSAAAPSTSAPASPTPTTPTTSTPPPPTTTSTTSTPQSTPPTTTAPPPASTTTTQPPPASSTTQPPPTTQVVTTIVDPSNPGSTITQTIVQTNPAASTPASTSAPATSQPPANNGASGSGGSGMSGEAKIAVAVVVPIAAVALLVLAALWFWRKRKARKEAEEQRRKEVEEYGFNPNADGPTVPNVGGGSYAMAEDTSSGYRGWGSTTMAGSTGRKASTTISSGAAAGAFSDINSPVRGNNMSDSRSSEPLMYDHAHGDGSISPEGEILGAMGPSAAANRGADVRRGPSNASSSYSAAARSDGSGDMNGIGMAYGGDQPSYGAGNAYGINSPYADNYGSSPPGPTSGMVNGGRGADFNGGTSSPIIKDNPARRNTRIENSSHYPQQAAGISQNF